MMDHYRHIFRMPVLLLAMLNASLSGYCRQQPQNNLSAKSSAIRPDITEYNKLISYYRYYKPDSAIYFVNKGIALAKRTKDDNGLAIMLNQSGMIDDNIGKFDDSRERYLAARNLYARIGSKKGIATETVRLGVVEMRKGNYDKAVEYFLDALKVSEQSGNAFGIMEANLTLGEGYMGEHKFNEAIHYFKVAERINSTIPFSNLSLNIFNDMGMYYRDNGNFDLAKQYFEKGIALSNKPQYQGLNISLTNNLASVYAKQGFKAKSIVLQKSSLAKARQIKNYLRELLTLTSLAETYGKDDPKSALIYFNQALNLVREKKAQKQEVEILGRMADMYHVQGKNNEAFLMKQQQFAIADEFFYQKMAKQINSLQSAYDLSKSVADVQALKFQNNRQQLERNIILTVATGIALVLMVMLLFYFRSKSLNELLHKANEDLKESNSVKDKLFSVLAHDLRSPLATIINLLYVISDDDVDTEQRRELVNMVAVSSNATLDILNNLLKWGEMQIKGIRLNQVDILPYQIVERNIALLAASAEQKSIKIQNLVDKDIGVLSDSDHFEFVIRNLLSNAIKFTPDSGVVVVSATTDVSAGTIIFKVKDNGVGIDPARINDIFSISNTSTKGTNDEIGTSLGLALCKEFIEANQGKIWVESKVGEGSEFIFELKKA